MEALLIIIGLVVVALVILGYLSICLALNEHCSQQDKMKPFNGWSVFAATLAAGGIYTGLYMIQDGGGIPNWPWSTAFVHSQAANGMVIAAAGGLIAMITFLS